MSHGYFDEKYPVASVLRSSPQLQRLGLSLGRDGNMVGDQDQKTFWKNSAIRMESQIMAALYLH